jgi:hypothetical protein
MIYPRPFNPPTIINDSPKARAKVKREALVILREMVRYFGLKEVKELLADIAKTRKGNKADKSLDALLVAQYDAAITKDPDTTRTDVARDFYERYRPQERYRLQSVRAVEKRLTRALQDREQKAERGRWLKALLQRPSLIGTIRTE